MSGFSGFGSRAAVDYEKAGEQLLSKLNLAEDGGGGTVHNNLDAVWADPTTGARVFIGNQQAAMSEAILRANGITHIINCQDPSAPNFHESNPDFHYCRFPIAHWFKYPMDDPVQVLAYFREPHGFIERALASGNGCLIHCLAGAHRAGSTGVSWLMHAAEMDQAQATEAAKQLRQVVNPFGHLLGILGKLDQALVARRADPSLGEQAQAAAAAGGVSALSPTAAAAAARSLTASAGSGVAGS